MNNTKVAFFGLIIFGVLALLASSVWNYFPNRNFQNPFKQIEPITSPIAGYRTVTDDMGAFNLEARYLGNNKWSYAITAQLATPCYGAIITELVRESYPEQVTIQITPTIPNEDILCAQVIQDFSYDGTFEASEQAKIGMVVQYPD